MTTDQRRILLDSSITAEDFADAAEVAGWTLIDEHDPGKTGVHELIYRAGEHGKSTVHYVEDTDLMVRYAAARGPDKAPLAAEIEELLPFVTDKAALDQAERDRDDLQEMVDWLLSAAALGDQAGHKRLVALVEKRLGHKSSAIRRAALLAASRLEWPDFRATIERLAKDEPDADTRKDASRLAKAYRLRDEGKL